MKSLRSMCPKYRGKITLPSYGTLYIGNNNKDTAYSGLLSGAGSAIIKIGSGTLTLSGANTFSTQLTVQSGSLAVSTINSNSVAGPLGNSALSVILGNAGGVTGTLRLTGTNTTYFSNKGFTLTTGGTGGFQIDNASTTQTISGVISGAGGLVKTGAGTLILTATNTYQGATTVNGGILGISNAYLSTNAAVSIANGGKLSLNFVGANAVNALYFDGTPVSPGVYGAANRPAYFSGTGTLSVQVGPPASGTLLIIQ